MSIRRIYSTPVILQVTPTAVSVGAESQIFHFWTSKHCVKSVQIRSFSGPYFPPLGLDMERYGVSLRIQSECGKIRTRKNSVFRHFSRGAKLVISKSTSLLLHIRKNIFHENANTFETGPVMISMKKRGFFWVGDLSETFSKFVNSHENNLIYIFLTRGRKNKWVLTGIVYWASSSHLNSFVHHVVRDVKWDVQEKLFVLTTLSRFIGLCRVSVM